MRRRNPRQQAVVNRIASTYFRQQMIGLAVGVFVVGIPFTFLEAILPLSLVALAAFVILTMGVWALCAGTADHSVQRAVHRGTWGSYFLLGSAPVALFLVFQDHWKIGLFPMLLWNAAGISACIGYLYFARRYWEYVASVHSPNKRLQPTGREDAPSG